MSLENWLQNGYLVKHQATVADVLKLLGVVDRELADAAVQGLSPDGRFMHAYDAALQLCTIALHASGYAVGRVKGHHNYTINSLPYTLGQQHADIAIYLSQCCTRRNHSLYDRAGVVSEPDARDLLEAACQLRAEVLACIRTEYPSLLPKGY
jgi:hypothetical protein